MDGSELQKTIGIIGSGPAGLISAQVLLKDGFEHVEVLTRDHSPGGVWAKERVPPNLKINK
jgi:dimethylaniline monooxygenase (N-oxide forming)